MLGAMTVLDFFTKLLQRAQKSLRCQGFVNQSEVGSCHDASEPTPAISEG